jgi:hypothetical protein
MIWRDYVEKRVHENVVACQRILGKTLTPGEVGQVRSMVSSIMKHERKARFRKLAEKKTGPDRSRTPMSGPVDPDEITDSS